MTDKQPWPKNIRRTALTLLTLVPLFSGCGHPSEVPAPPVPPVPPSAQSQQTKVQAIQNNPGMPDAEKAAILRSQSTPPPAPAH